jgi:adenine-specific DNA-methyltransferase
MSLPVNQIIQGDCLEVMKQWPDKCVDVVITDPPYGTQDLAGGYGRRQLWDKGDGNGRTIANDCDLSQIKVAYPEFQRIVKDGWAIVFYGARKTPEFIDATSSTDWFGSLIYDKGVPGLGFHIRYAHEDIAVFKIGKPKKPPQALMSVLKATRTSIHHPHEKPVEIMQQLVRWACPDGGIVLDPFCGSGTTCVAAELLGRKYIGIELDPKYCEIARKRVKDAQEQFALLELKP